MDKDYNAMFQLLVNKAIKDGWSPIWIDRIKGSNCELGAGDIAAEWFYFSPPQEMHERK